MRAKVHVFLKPGVLDVQGKAVEQALHGLGWSGVEHVRVGRTIEFDLKSADQAAAEQLERDGRVPAGVAHRSGRRTQPRAARDAGNAGAPPGR